LTWLFFLSTPISTLVSIWCKQTVACGNVILWSVHGWVTPSKTFTCTQSSIPFALGVNH
jgi:hypothetical protein